MNEEIELLVQAIESLKQEENIVKDYIFPLVSAFFAALFGGLFAYFVFWRQEKIKIERNKMEAVNRWTLSAEESFRTLMSIKNNYHGKLSDNPIQRAASIPTVLLVATPITASIPDLHFLIPNDEGTGAEYPKWSQLSRIDSMKANFNLLISYWKKRNEIDRPIKEKIINKYSNLGFCDISTQQIIECVGGTALTSLIDLTEQTVKLTDDIIIELDDFLNEFPAFAKQKINEKRVKPFGSIMKYSSKENPHIQKLLQRSPKPNFEHIEELFGAKTEDIESRYKTGYEKEL